MTRILRLLAWLSLVAVTLTGCGHKGEATPSGSTPDPSQAVYSDTFGNASSGWATTTTKEYVAGYGAYKGTPAYVIRTLSTLASDFATSPVNSLPHKLEIVTAVSVSSQSSSGRGEAGVGCDYDGSGYLLMFRPGATYELVQIADGGVSATLGRGSSAAMSVLTGLNTLQLICLPMAGGMQVTALINGVEVATSTDPQTAPNTAKHVSVWLRGLSDNGQSDAGFTSVQVFSKN